MQAARGVYDQHISVARFGGLDRIEQDSRRVSSLSLLNQRHARTLGPDGKLIVCRRAKGVRRADQYFMALAPDAMRQLAYGRRLAHAVYAYDHNHIRLYSERNFRFARHSSAMAMDRSGIEYALKLGFDETLEFIDIAQLIAAHFEASLVDYFKRGLHAYVGADESFFKLVKHVRVYLAPAAEDSIESFGYAFARRGDGGFEPIEEPRFRLVRLLSYGRFFCGGGAIESEAYQFVFFFSFPERHKFSGRHEIKSAAKHRPRSEQAKFNLITRRKNESTAARPAKTSREKFSSLHPPVWVMRHLTMVFQQPPGVRNKTIAPSPAAVDNVCTGGRRPGKEIVMRNAAIAMIVVAVTALGVIFFLQVRNISSQSRESFNREIAEPVSKTDPAARVSSSIQPASGSINWEQDINRAIEKAKAGDKVIVVDVYTDWCGWCKKMDQVIYSDPLIVGLSQREVFLKIDAEDGGQGEAFANRMGVRAYPTTIILDSDGAQITSKKGFISSSQQFIRFVEDARTRKTY
jgi:thiol-disulfide isomerase/thioredoxin